MTQRNVTKPLALAAILSLAAAAPGLVWSADAAGELEVSIPSLDGAVVAQGPSGNTGVAGDVSVSTGAAESEAAAASEAAAEESAPAAAAGTDDLDPAEAPPAPLVPKITGDDVLPSLSEIGENPYYAISRQAGLEDVPPVQEAYVPPAIETTREERTRTAGQELIDVLGQDVYNQRVNISTPPDTEIAEVVRLLAERAQLNFVYASGVITGRVTLNLKDVPLGVALQSLLSAQDLALVREGENVLRIVARKDIQPGQVETRTIYVKLNWVTADTISRTLEDFAGGSSRGRVKFHKESNTVIVTDTPTNVALVRDLIAQLDVPQKQVMIEARLVELIIRAGRQLGSRTNIYRDDGSGLSQLRQRVEYITTNDEGIPEVGGTLDVPVDALFGGNLLSGDPRSTQLGFGTVINVLGSELNLSAVLDGLEERNVANVLANPRIITLNNEEALIDIMRKEPYLEAQQGVSQNAVSATVKFEELGVRLAVLPTITNNGFVRMRLQPDQRILAAQFQTPQGPIPIVDRRTALTNVIVKDEDTVVLGGLRQIESADSKNMTPWLGQTPIIGWFFKSSAKGHRKNDLMLFVTPHIIKAPTLTTAENYKHSRIDAHWDLPDYFFEDSVEGRENHHRGELDMTSRNYYPDNLRLPPLDGGDAAAAAGVYDDTK